MTDVSRKQTALRGRPDNPTIGGIEDILGACVGIRYAVGAINARNPRLADRQELDTILDLVDLIQTTHAALRAIAASAYHNRNEP